MLHAYTYARIIDPATNRDHRGTVFLDGGQIIDITQDDTVPSHAKVHDCGGRILSPGLVDMRAHAVDIAAAHAGGITTIALQPGQTTTIDADAVVERIRRRAKENGKLHVHPMAAATKGLKGQEIAEIGQMLAAGACAVTDGRQAVADAQIMRRLMEYSSFFDALIVQFAEEPSLSAGGFAHEGEIATRLGFNGIPAVAEMIQIERDIRLAETLGARLHIALVSAAGSVDIIRAAKKRGVRISAATAPHYLYLNDQALEGFRTFAKLSPPLRSEDDRLALLGGVADGTIDTLVSDHDPRSEDVKRLPFAQAAPGVSAFETLLPLTLTQVHGGHLDMMAALKALTISPALHLGLDDAGRLKIGGPADFVVFAPNKPWKLDRQALKSAAKNMIQDSLLAQGKVWRTVVAGQIMYEDSL